MTNTRTTGTGFTRMAGMLLGLIMMVAVLGGCGLGPVGNPGAGDTGAKAVGYGTVYGTVRDSVTTARLAGVTVTTAGKTATTDAYGRFSVAGVPKGTQSISFSKNGYETFTRSYNLWYSSVQLKLVYLVPKPVAPAPAPVPEPTPTPTPTPVPAPTPIFTLTAQEAEMLNLLNAERTKGGLQPFIADQKLTGIARSHSQDMIDNKFFSHTSPTTGSPFDRLKAAGITYRTAGENIAGNQTVLAAHTSLMNSSGHKANIMNASFTHIGVGIRAGGLYGLYFTQLFIGR